MKKETVENIIEGMHKLTNPTVKATVSVLEECYLVWKIDERRKERGLTQQQLAKMTGLRPATISKWENGKQGIDVNFTIFFTIMAALNITKLSDIVEVRIPPEMNDRFESNSNEWISDKRIPFQVLEMQHEIAMKAAQK
ncbi:helix-turn-helix transcriptional regulator [Bacillus mexicanus]|uniref:helix-turn-helix domain-containing protein n=1 Tax=Bacillus mexicanus TaxID=2834415 RepID=UPI003D20F308